MGGAWSLEMDNFKKPPPNSPSSMHWDFTTDNADRFPHGPWQQLADAGWGGGRAFGNVDGPPESAAVVSRLYIRQDFAENVYVTGFVLLALVALRCFFPAGVRDQFKTQLRRIRWLEEPKPRQPEARTTKLAELREALDVKLHDVMLQLDIGDMKRLIEEREAENPHPGLVIAIETSKTIPLIYLILSSAVYFQYTCQIPRILFNPPAQNWFPIMMHPNGGSLSGSMQLYSFLGYSDQQIMAVWALRYVAPSLFVTVALFLGEGVSLTIFLYHMKNLHKPSFAIPGALLCMIMSAFWFAFSVEAGVLVRFWNTPYDANAPPWANMLNQTAIPPLWMDPDGPETIVCMSSHGFFQAIAISCMHFLSMFFFVHNATPKMGSWRDQLAKAKSWWSGARKLDADVTSLVATSTMVSNPMASATVAAKA
jgi:hypothetical protein